MTAGCRRPRHPYNKSNCFVAFIEKAGCLSKMFETAAPFSPHGRAAENKLLRRGNLVRSGHALDSYPVLGSLLSLLAHLVAKG